MDYQQIDYAVADRIATITLDRPEQMNAFTERMRGELIDAFDRIDADDSVRAAVVTGRGRAFCAGADLGRGGSTFAAKTEEVWRDGGGTVSLRIFNCTKPVIGAINGAAVGVGVTMSLPMDIRIAADTARFGFVFTRRGIVPEACSSWFLPRVVGISQALDWVMSGRVFPAAEALAGGLVKEVVAADQVLPRAYAMAREIADNTSGVSVALARQMLWRMLGADHPMQAHRIDSRGISAMGRSPDAAEGVTSFLEKRPPNFAMQPSRDMPAFFPWWQEPEFS